MFIHATKCKGPDRHTAKEIFDHWLHTVAPVAVGWLGSVAGMTPSAMVVHVARWRSERAFRACGRRPEQRAFDERLLRTLAGPPEAFACATVDPFLRGGSDEAGFVQVIFGRVVDESRARTVHQELEVPFGQHRPDAIGGTIGWVGDGRFVETMYFTSQFDARDGERKELPANLKTLEDQFAGFIDGELDFNDLSEPWFLSPRS